MVILDILVLAIAVSLMSITAFCTWGLSNSVRLHLKDYSFWSHLAGVVIPMDFIYMIMALVYLVSALF